MALNLYDYHPDKEKAPGYDVAHETVPALVWEKYKKQPKELKKREKVLAKNAETAYLYAYKVLKAPFPAGEPAVAKSVFAIQYAANVLKGRPFPAGETEIAKDAFSAFFYAAHNLKGPFPAGEAAIGKSPAHAYRYAVDVLRLPEKEAKVWPKKLKESLLVELLALKHPGHK